MIVSLQYFELKRALIILSLIGSHSTKVFAFSLDTIRATPWVGVSLCPEYRITDSPLVTWHPEPVQQLSLTPRISSLYLLNISQNMGCLGRLIHCADIPCPNAEFSSRPKKTLFHTPDSLWQVLIRSGHTAKRLARVYCRPNGKVVACCSFRNWMCSQGGVVDPTPNPQPGGPGAVVCLSSHLGPVQLS